MKFLLPQGLGDAVWGLTKVQDIAAKLGDGKVDVLLNCSNPDDVVQRRSLLFASRFDFVNSANMLKIPIIQKGGELTKEGYYRYIPDGPYKDDPDLYVLMPNAALERGVRLEHWLPAFDINWDIMDSFNFDFHDSMYVENLKNSIGEYVTFFMAHENGNSGDGHNRGPMWTPEEWVQLGDEIFKRYGYKIVIVGSAWDKSYYDKYIYPKVYNKKHWFSIIGECEITKTFAVTKAAKFMISFQSGVGIISSYMGTPLGIFWRPKGNSISPRLYISFEEEMASAWASPIAIKTGKHLPLIYGRHSVTCILNEIHERGWAK